MIEKLAISESEAAEMLSLSVSALRKWRRLGCGPRWRKLNYSVRYLIKDIAQWLEENSQGGRSQ